MFSIEEKKAEKPFKKMDNRPMEKYNMDEQKRIKDEMQNNFGMDIVLLLMAAELSGFTPKNKQESKQQQAKAATIHLMSQFFGSKHSFIADFAKTLTMSKGMDYSYRKKLSM